MSPESVKDPFADRFTLESQEPQPTQKQSFFHRLYHTPYKHLPAWGILLRIAIAILIGAVVGVVIGLIVRYT